MNFYLKKLEYDKILCILSEFCITQMGKTICKNLLPYNSSEIVKQKLEETNEAISLLYRLSTPPIYEIKDNIENIKIIESYGTLSIQSIIDLTKVLITASELKKYFFVDLITINEYPILNDLFNNLYTNESIIKQIKHCISDEQTINDKASSELEKIRKKQRNIEQEIKNKLNNFIHSSNYAKYIQENIITIRNDRYVIPVKEEYRSQIKGFIHDISSSGSTYFIEPIAIFELNNELTNLKIEENVEIEKILLELSKSFYPYSNELKNNINIITNLDFIFAKAKYSKSINGIQPLINTNKKIILNNAKHPLLNLDTAVPISLTLGESYNSLIITGPNTGGKTVTLKTVGLLTAMACSGLNIPAKNESSIYVFDNIFADIGDDQSISDSLSTFSSHISNIVNIIEQSTSNSLILVDELGSGTDPIEGASLAISILEYFHNKNCLTIATTHYSELKKYALMAQGFENASVEFNINTLSPTYKLLIGVPGKSNAFEISKKLGLSDRIIESAKKSINENEFEFEEVLKSIYDNKSIIENEKIQISNNLKEIESIKKSLNNKETKLKEKENEIINSAKTKARTILLETKEEANLIISEMKTKSNTNKDLNNLRNMLNDDIKKLNIDTNTNTIDISKQINKNDIKPNVDVFVTTLGQNGTILSNISKSNEVTVQVGSMKMNINIKYLQKIEKQKKSSSTTSYNISKTKTAKTEINVIGLNSEEAIFVVDKFLDDSYLAKLKTVRIVHGKGTGKLRTEIHKFLKHNSHVKDFRIGTFGEGEMGVTIVELK